MMLRHLIQWTIGVSALAASICLAQVDPGVRRGPPGAGASLPGLTPVELEIFNEGVQRFIQLEAVCDSCTDVTLGQYTDPALANFVTLTNSAGLGSRFNADQCSVCHNQPALGGSGGFVVPNPQDGANRYRPPENPMFDLIPHRKGATNGVPSFIQQYGPIREVRFARNPDGTPDGGVHQLFTVVGRTDTGSSTCTNAALPPIDFEGEYQRGNTRFRIPLQLFGLGIIDGIQDREILARQAATATLRQQLGIQGIPNRSGNNGTITRFGWKAQNKSLAVFAGEAYNVEMGITNDVFPQATDETAACNVDKSEPNDITRTDPNDVRNQSYYNPKHILADWLQFAMFMRFLDAPKPAAFSPSAQRGQQLFGTGPSNAGIGCVACHTAQMITPPQSETPALQNVTANLYSDLLVHHMGKTLADDITQGAATGDMFRTTPLWGVGQRFFFLHDGRTSDLMQAIQAHFSPALPCTGTDIARGTCYGPSEANAVIGNFNALKPKDQQSILDFLRAL